LIEKGDEAMRVLKIAAAVLLWSAPLYAQDDAARREAAEVAKQKLSAELMARVPFEKAVKGAPYSAETITENSQTLADGNRIDRKTTGRIYRDGEGRTRREEDRRDGTVAVSIVDPVAGTSYSLDPSTRTAWKTGTVVASAIMSKVEASQVNAAKDKAMAEKAATEKVAIARQGGAATARVGEVRDGMKVTAIGPDGVMTGYSFTVADTPLEHKTIEGVAVEGRKTTSTIPAGKVGNEQPILVTSEEWSSTDLKVLVLTRYSDPRTGESSYRLTNIVRAEPDHALFTVPSDYTIKETGIRRMEPSRRD
jgi:hypothetical protein